jgi:hypothetical protein
MLISVSLDGDMVGSRGVHDYEALLIHQNGGFFVCLAMSTPDKPWLKTGMFQQNSDVNVMSLAAKMVPHNKQQPSGCTQQGLNVASLVSPAGHAGGRALSACRTWALH